MAVPAIEKIGDRGYIESADAICGAARREKRLLGRNLIPVGTAPLDTTTEQLVAPGIEILEREAARLRAIQPRPENPSLETYLGLFDPILVLAEQRLQAGRSGDSGTAATLENSVTDLEDAQRLAAVAAGLDECGLGFAAALSGAKP